jgi:hypothetical protein
MPSGGPNKAPTMISGAMPAQPSSKVCGPGGATPLRRWRRRSQCDTSSRVTSIITQQQMPIAKE